MSKKFPLSVVVITKNEADKIDECLKSAGWVDDIIIVDDFSIDATAKIASAHTNRIYERKMDVEGRHRNYAYSLAKNEWVFSLDADERMSDELREEIKRVLKKGTAHVAFTVPIRTYIGDHWMRYGDWYPGRKTRLFKKNEFKYEEASVHPRAIYRGTCGHLKGNLRHYSYNDIHDFIVSLNNQTLQEARKWFDEKRGMGFIQAVWKSKHRFLKSYIVKQGFRDGLYGFIAAYFSGLYQFFSYIKYWEMRRNTNKKHD